MTNIVKPKTVNEALYQGRIVFDSLKKVKPGENDYFDDASCTYLGLLIWYLKMKEEKYNREDLVTLDTLKALVKIEISSIPMLLLYSTQKINSLGVMPFESWVKFGNSTKALLSISEITSNLFGKEDFISDNTAVMKILATEVNENLEFIKNNLKLIHTNGDELYEEERALKLWLKIYN